MYRRQRDTPLPSMTWPPSRLLRSDYRSRSRSSMFKDRPYTAWVVSLFGSLAFILAGIVYLRSHREFVAVKCNDTMCRVARLSQGKWHPEQALPRAHMLRTVIVRLDRYSKSAAPGYTYGIVYSEPQPQVKSTGDRVRAAWKKASANEAAEEVKGGEWPQAPGGKRGIAETLRGGATPVTADKWLEAGANAEMELVDDHDDTAASRVPGQSQWQQQAAQAAKQESGPPVRLQRQSAMRFASEVDEPEEAKETGPWSKPQLQRQNAVRFGSGVGEFTSGAAAAAAKGEWLETGANAEMELPSSALPRSRGAAETLRGGAAPVRGGRWRNAAANADMELLDDYDDTVSGEQSGPLGRSQQQWQQQKAEAAAREVGPKGRPPLQRQNAARFGAEAGGLAAALGAQQNVEDGAAAGSGVVPRGASQNAPSGSGVDAEQDPPERSSTSSVLKRIGRLDARLRPRGLSFDAGDGDVDNASAAAAAGANTAESQQKHQGAEGGGTAASGSGARRNAISDQGGSNGPRTAEDNSWDVSIDRGQRRLTIATWDIGRVRTKIGVKALEQYMLRHGGYSEALYLEERKLWRAGGVLLILIGLAGLLCSTMFLGDFRKLLMKARRRQ